MNKDVLRVQKWRRENPGKYKDLEKNRVRDRRDPKIKFLEKIGFDRDRDTLRREQNWLVLHHEKTYTIRECYCNAPDCQGFALIENNETALNLHNNMMYLKEIGVLVNARQCITKRLK